VIAGRQGSSAQRERRDESAHWNPTVHRWTVEAAGMTNWSADFDVLPPIKPTTLNRMGFSSFARLMRPVTMRVFTSGRFRENAQ
jgi:hypothetical protein